MKPPMKLTSRSPEAAPEGYSLAGRALEGRLTRSREERLATLISLAQLGPRRPSAA
jgi:hypothetical protein